MQHTSLTDSRVLTDHVNSPRRIAVGYTGQAGRPSGTAVGKTGAVIGNRNGSACEDAAIWTPMCVADDRKNAL